MYKTFSEYTLNTAILQSFNEVYSVRERLTSRRKGKDEKEEEEKKLLKNT